MATLGQEVDRLTEAVAVVRLVIADARVVSAAEGFEHSVKEIERAHWWNEDRQVVQLTPLIRAAQEYENRDHRVGSRVRRR